MPTDISEVQVACFSIGGELFAVDIMRIREIIRPPRLTHLVKMPDFLDGILNLRGTVIPVINLRRRFDLPPQEDHVPGKLLIVSLAKQQVGFAVDDVTEVVTLPVRNIKPPPPVVKGIGSQYVLGVCLVGDQMISLLNIDRLLSDTETRSLGSILTMS